MTTRQSSISPSLRHGGDNPACGLVEGGCQGTVRRAMDDAPQAYRRASDAAERILQYHVRFQPRVMSAIVLPEFGPAFDRLKSLVLIMLERSDEFVCGDVLLLDVILKIGCVKVQVTVFVGSNELAELLQNWLASRSGEVAIEDSGEDLGESELQQGDQFRTVRCTRTPSRREFLVGDFPAA